MNAHQLQIATVPLALYFVWLAMINLRRRATVTTGAAELVRWACALTGLILVGPLQLAMPEEAAYRLGGWVWLPILALLALLLLFLRLSSKPRIVIYNLAAEEFVPLLQQVSQGLDAEATTCNAILNLPSLHLQAVVEAWPSMKSHVILATSRTQSWAVWQKLFIALRAELGKRTSQPNPRGWTFAMIAALLMGLPYLSVSPEPSSFAEVAARLLRIDRHH
jgi:hypothetical protein